MMAKSVWASSSTLASALAKGGEDLDASFDRDDKAHQDAVFGLSQKQLESLIALLGGPAGLRRRFPNALALLAQDWAMNGRAADALKLLDALIECDHQEQAAFGIALWAVVDDNTHLGVDEKRARRYLERALAREDCMPETYFNATFTLMELGDEARALDVWRTAMKRGFPKNVARQQLETERLLASVRSNEDFLAALETP